MSCDSYTNWGHQINNTHEFLVIYPRTNQQITAIVTHAYLTGKYVRVQGYRHSYPPLTVSHKDDPSTTVIIDMKRHMNRLRMGSMIVPSANQIFPTRLNVVIAETGASMQDLLTFTQQNGFGFVDTPIIGGDATVGGVLAIGGHGAGIRALNEKLTGPGFTFGSDSNAIVELQAVVWNQRLGKYVLRSFRRNDPDISAFLVHIGRAIITQVTLMVGENYNMSCVSRVDIPASELFAYPNNASARTISNLMDKFGRADATWFPFVENLWFRTWEVTDERPTSSKEVTEPYNYQFKYTIDDPKTPATEFGPQCMEKLVNGLTEKNVWDIWGPSQNTLLSYNRSSSSLVFGGFVVLTKRANVQLVLHDISQFYESLLDEYAAKGIYPIDQYAKFRVTEVDDPENTLIPGAVAADIAPLRPVTSRPDFNVGVWMNTLTTTNRPYSNEFGMRLEEFVYNRFNGDDGLARPEWSKNWGYAESGPFVNQAFIREMIPVNVGINEWNHAIQVWDKYDPHQVITNEFLRMLLVPFDDAGSVET